MSGRSMKKLSRAGLPRENALARGLIMAWGAYEGAGPTIHDLAERRRLDMTLAGDAAWGVGPYGRYVAFSGAAGTYAASAATTLPDTGRASWALLFTRLSAPGGGNEQCFAKDNGSQWGPYFQIVSNKVSGGFYDGGVRSVTATVEMSVGETALYVITYDRAALRIYRNGTLNNTANYAGSIQSTSGIWNLARLRAGGSYYYNANIRIYAAYVWDRQLAASEIVRLYADPYGILRPRDTLIAALATPDVDTIVRLTWTDNSEGEDEFSIERNMDGEGFVEIDTVAAGAETYDDDPEIGHTYTYRVRALNAAKGDSEYSNEAEVTV